MWRRTHCLLALSWMGCWPKVDASLVGQFWEGRALDSRHGTLTNRASLKLTSILPLCNLCQMIKCFAELFSTVCLFTLRQIEEPFEEHCGALPKLVHFFSRQVPGRPSHFCLNLRRHIGHCA